MTADSSPALIIRFPPATTSDRRERLLALLTDYSLVAIQEDDVASPRTWTAHFGDSSARDAAAVALSRDGGTQLEIETAEIADDDWARRTQADLPAVRIGRIIVAPPWDLPPPFATPPLGRESDIVVEIEPSRGFGTGHHQSTRLCLALLQNRALDGRTIVDVGTGSGVLAIAAAKLGAAVVAAIDADPDAIDNTRENIERNRVGHLVDAHVRDLTEPGLPRADLVTANLTGTLLVRHADALSNLVRPGGSLIVAGFTVDEKSVVTEAFGGTLHVSESAEEDDWWAFVMTRRG